MTPVIQPAQQGHVIDVAGIATRVHDVGSGRPVLLLHGSGPGVSAWANWRLVLPALAEHHRVVAPDQIGFGGTQTGAGTRYGREAWTEHALALMDELGIDRYDVIGNSMGGAIAFSMAARRPEAVRRIVNMGSMGIDMPIPDGLEQVWAYRPDIERMRDIVELFAYDRSIATDDLIRLRYEASAEPEVAESWAEMFPTPQAGVDDLALSAEELASIEQPVLLVHGTEDRVIPWRDTSLPLLDVLANVRLHLFRRCGHWVMIERTAEFASLVLAWLALEDDAL